LRFDRVQSQDTTGTEINTEACSANATVCKLDNTQLSGAPNATFVVRGRSAVHIERWRASQSVLIVEAIESITVNASMDSTDTVDATTLVLRAPLVRLVGGVRVANFSVFAQTFVIDARVPLNVSARAPPDAPDASHIGLGGNVSLPAARVPLSLAAAFGGASGTSRGGGAIAIACAVDCQIAGFLAANGDAGAAGGSIVVNATAKLTIDTSLALFEALGGAGRDDALPAGGGGGKVVFLVPPTLVATADAYIVASLPLVRVDGGRAFDNSTLHGGAGAFLVATPTVTQSILYIHGRSALARGSTPLPLLPVEAASTVASFGTVSLENVQIAGALDGLANVNVRKAVQLGTRDQLDLVVAGNVTLTEDASLLAERIVVRAERLLLQKQATLVALRVAAVPPMRANMSTVAHRAHGGANAAFGGVGVGGTTPNAPLAPPAGAFMVRVGGHGEYFRDSNASIADVPGGAGGGTVTVEVTGGVQLADGAALIADGAPATAGGAGAGGSVSVRCSSLTGTGTLSAMGGAPSRELGGGGGSGGLLFVDVLGTLPATIKLLPFGGAAPAASGDAAIADGAVWRSANASTTPPTDGGAGVLLVASRSANTRVYRVLGNSTNARLGAAGAVALDASALLTATSVIVERAQLGGAAVSRASLIAPLAHVELRLVRMRGTTITLNVTSLLLANTSLIDADARSNDTVLATTPNFGAGGGYGGNGGKHSGEATMLGSNAFGSSTQPVRGVAGVARGSMLPGGLGGGLIDIVALAVAVIDGDVTASGGVGARGTAAAGGSGSGGGIALRARDIGGAGKVRVVGGASVQVGETAVHGGAGGGGRIAVTGFARLNASLGFDVGGGPSTGQAGGSGTLYVRNVNGSLDEVRFIGLSEAVSGSRNADAGTPWPDGVVPGAYIRNKYLTPTDEVQQVLNTTGNMRIENGLLTANAIRLIVGGALVIDNRTVITVQGKGPEYANAGASAGEGAIGNTTVDGSGGGFGGFGLGSGAGASFNFSTTYLTPTIGGRSGGLANNTAGGRGGGRIRFEVGGHMTIDGAVLASGADSQKIDATGTGAGSGGSIWIAVNDVVNGSGVISANGGSAALENGTAYGSPGGGGRIALYYGGSVASSLRVTAFGGTRGVAAQAGAGTVFLKNTLTSQSQLLVANSLSNITSAQTRIDSTVLQALVVTDGARVAMESASLRAGTVNITRNGFLMSTSKNLLVQTEILTVVGGTIANGRIVVCGRVISIGTGGLVTADGQGVDEPLLRGAAAEIGGGNIGVGGACNATAPKRAGTATLVELIAFGDGGRGGGADGALGGGRVWLSAVESIDLNGATVTASGNAGSATGGGAGAGGFVLLMSPRVTASGAVAVRARGGSAFNTTIGGGAGGGGAVHVLTASAVNETVLGVNVSGGVPNTNLNACTGAGPACS
jgi:hypothetical protein